MSCTLLACSSSLTAATPEDIPTTDIIMPTTTVSSSPETFSIPESASYFDWSNLNLYMIMHYDLVQATSDLVPLNHWDTNPMFDVISPRLMNMSLVEKLDEVVDGYNWNDTTNRSVAMGRKQ
jgi:hypothetical protein